MTIAQPLSSCDTTDAADRLLVVILIDPNLLDTSQQRPTFGRAQHGHPRTACSEVQTVGRSTIGPVWVLRCSGLSPVSRWF